MTWHLLQNSLLVAGCSALLGAILGTLFALFAAALPRIGRLTCMLIAAGTFVLPPFLVSNTWLNFFGLNGSWRGYVDFDIYSLRGTILLITLQLWPVSFLLVLGSILRIDRVYLEQESLLRGTALLRYLVWPLSRSTLAFAVLLSFVLALNNFTVPTLLQTKVFAEEVWLSFNTKFDYTEALKLSWPMIAAPFALLLLVRPGAKPFVARTNELSHTLWCSRLGLLLPLSFAPSCALIVLSICLPVAQLLGSSRTWTELLPAIEAGRSALTNSLLFGLLPAFLVMAFGILAAKRRFGVVSWLLYLTPGVLIGIALIRVFNRPSLSAFYQSIGIVLVAFLLRYFALGWSTARAAIALTDRSTTDMISVLGGSRWQQFRLAIWPQNKRLLFGGFYLVYLICLWEVETLILIVPPGRETLALRVFNMLHYGHAGQVDALCLWIVGVGLVPLAVWGCFELVAATTTKQLPPARTVRIVAGGLIAKVGTGLSMTGHGFLFGFRRASLKVLALVLPVLAISCSPEKQNFTKVQSRLFSSVQVFGSRGTGAGQFNKPRSIAVDREDNFYVVDMTGRVQKFSPDGNFLLSWQMPQTDKGKPKGMACDSDGNIIVVEPHYSRVNHFSPQGKLVGQWGENGTNGGQLYFPRCVAVNSHGEVYLAEYGMVERIQHFSARGANFIDSIGRPGTGPGELNRGEGIAIGPDDTLFEADSCNHRVQVFSPEGKLITAFGTAGSAPNELSYPYDVRIDPLGYRFVCEFGNSRVQVFDAHNRSFEILGGPGAEAGQMNNPWAIALDSSGNLYVADSLNHRVQKFIRREPLAPRHTRALGPRSRVAAR